MNSIDIMIARHSETGSVAKKQHFKGRNKMSKKAIKSASAQVETSGFLAGMAQYRKEDTSKLRADVLKYSEALSMLNIMGWADAYELLARVYDKAATEGYENAKAVAEYNAKYSV